MRPQHLNIAVIGSGYVGLVAGACFAEMGHRVILVDINEEKVGRLQAGECPIFEDHLPQLLDKHRGKLLNFTTDLVGAIRTCKVVFIAVGTPTGDDGVADLSQVETVVAQIAKGIQTYTVVVEKSTVPVRTSDRVYNTLLRHGVPENLFDVVSNPEFLREGTAVLDFLYPDRIVVGANNEKSAAILHSVYAPLTEGTYYQRQDAMIKPYESPNIPQMVNTSAKSAELIKHASNAFLAMKISYINAVAAICEEVGADINEVVRGVGSDGRIGPRFLNPGIGFGGSCFPKDLKAFRSVAQSFGQQFGLLDHTISINYDQQHRFIVKIQEAVWTLKGKKIAVAGLAFKNGTDDIRESPAI